MFWDFLGYLQPQIGGTITTIHTMNVIIPVVGGTDLAWTMMKMRCYWCCWSRFSVDGRRRRRCWIVVLVQVFPHGYLVVDEGGVSLENSGRVLDSPPGTDRLFSDNKNSIQHA